MLTVATLEATITFYRDFLGFQCVSRVDYWAALRNGEAEVMIALPNAHVPFEKPAFTGSLYFNPDDVDALWDSLRDGVTIVYPIENFFYGMREFAILDNNGYMLQFGQEIEYPSLIQPVGVTYVTPAGCLRTGLAGTSFLFPQSVNAPGWKTGGQTAL
jgi:uncharacterized glyoxalase superfamily protein PhnB